MGLTLGHGKRRQVFQVSGISLHTQYISLPLRFLCILTFSPSVALAHAVIGLTMSPLPFPLLLSLPPWFLELYSWFSVTDKVNSWTEQIFTKKSAAPVAHEDGYSDKLFSLILRWICGFLSPYFFQYMCFLLDSEISVEDIREHAFIQLTNTCTNKKDIMVVEKVICYIFAF